MLAPILPRPIMAIFMLVSSVWMASGRGLEGFIVAGGCRIDPVPGPGSDPLVGRGGPGLAAGRGRLG